MSEVVHPVAADLAAAVKEERHAGLAKSWRNVTTLLHVFDVDTLADGVSHQIHGHLTGAGLKVLPPHAEWKRQTKVRLLLPDEDPRAPQDLLAKPLVSVTRWVEGLGPQPAELEDLRGDGLFWIDVHPSAEVEAVFALLHPVRPELSLEAIEDLVQVDDLPSATDYDGIRKVSTVAVRADENDRSSEDDKSKAGRLVFQMVELLVGEEWMISCWHEPRGPLSELPADMTAEKKLSLDAVKEAWTKQAEPTIGTLGLLLFCELAASYVPARRTLYSWLEQWELKFHQSEQPPEQTTLRELRFMVSEFQRRLNSFDESRFVIAEHSWFPQTSLSPLDQRVDAMLQRSIEGLESLSGELRAAVDLLTTAGISEHMRLARVASEKTDKLQDQVGLVASVLLVPTFIAGLFGANTEVPGQGHWSGFVGMIGLMVAGSLGTYAFFQRIKKRVVETDGNP